jgi:flagellar hook protein FlgE
MGLFGAMTTAVGGLRAQAFALENVSGNIANSQTTGFKRVDTSFADLVPDSTPQLQLAGGVLARSRGTNNVQGDIQNASVNTFMAINGPGYFIVQKPSAFPDGTPVFTGVDLFSRRGDFQLDKDGYLVNGTGYYLKVLRVDGTTGNVTGSVPEVLQFSNDFLPAQPTTLIEYRANLATFPRTGQSNVDVPGSERLNTAAFSVDPTNAGSGVVVGNDLPTFIAQSIAGGAVTMYDSVGSSVNIQLRWAKLADQVVNIQSSPIVADVAAVGVGTGVSIAADAPALLQGGVGGLAGADTLDSLGFTNGEEITISDGTNTITHTIVDATTEDLDAVFATLNGGAATWVISIQGGFIEVESNNATDTLSITGDNLAAIGFTDGDSADPSSTTLAALAGETLTVNVTGQPAINVIFGTGPGQVSNRVQLLAALGSIGSINGSDELVLTAPNNTSDIAVTGTGTVAADLGFGGANDEFEPTNADLGALTGDLTVQLGAGAPFTITFGTNDGADEVNNRAELAARLAVGAAATGLSLSINGAGEIEIASATDELVEVSGTPATLAALGLTAQTAQGSTTPTWELFYQESSTATGSNVAWRNAGVSYTFNASGQMTSPTQVVTLNDVTINGLPLGEITINHGDSGITQFSDVNGNAQVNLLRQNGYPAGNLQGISVNEKGRVIATYSNGRTLEMAEIVLASFNADNSLKRLDGGAFEATSESGQAQYGAAGKIIAKSLEGSNTDIADEFTKLIVTQQAYAANTRIVTTSDQMLQETLNMVR